MKNHLYFVFPLFLIIFCCYSSNDKKNEIKNQKQLEFVTNVINNIVKNDFLINLNDVWDPIEQKWYLKKGDIDIQIIIINLKNIGRTYLETASPIYKVPRNKQLDFYQKLLELNDKNLGMKFSIQENSDQVWLISEIDIDNINTTQIKTIINDSGYWAEKMVEILKKEFPLEN